VFSIIDSEDPLLVSTDFKFKQNGTHISLYCKRIV